MKLKGTHLILISLSKGFYGSRQVGRATNCPNHPMAQMPAWARLSAGRAGRDQDIFCSLVRSSLKACWQLIVKLSFCLSFSSSFNKRLLLRAFLVLGCWATLDHSPPPPVRKRGFAARCPQLAVRSKVHTQRCSPVSGAGDCWAGLTTMYTWKNSSLLLIATGFYRNKKESVLLLKFSPKAFSSTV